MCNLQHYITVGVVRDDGERRIVVSRTSIHRKLSGQRQSRGEEAREGGWIDSWELHRRGAHVQRTRRGYRCLLWTEELGVVIRHKVTRRDGR